MPILDVEIVLRPGEEPAPDLSADLARAAAKAFGAPAGRTWVKVRPLPALLYAEDADGKSKDVYPVFVRVLKARRPAPGELETEIVRLTQAMAEACGRPAVNVHVLYEADAVGRLAFGGRLVSR